PLPGAKSSRQKSQSHDSQIPLPCAQAQPADKTPSQIPTRRLLTSHVPTGRFRPSVQFATNLENSRAETAEKAAREHLRPASETNRQPLLFSALRRQTHARFPYPPPKHPASEFAPDR